jgi:hypothetical protein
MIRPLSEFSHATWTTEDESAREGAAHALQEQATRRLSGGARGLEIDVCHDSATVTLAGVVSSFYAKQVLYHLCGLCTPGFRVIDRTVVGSLSPQQAGQQKS